MTHAIYVASAYGISALTLGALISWLVIDQRGRRRDLAEMEAKGVRRRSATEDVR